MIGPRAGTRVWLAAGIKDMRCGIDSLAAKERGHWSAGAKMRSPGSPEGGPGLRLVLPQGSLRIGKAEADIEGCWCDAFK